MLRWTLTAGRALALGGSGALHLGAALLLGGHGPAPARSTRTDAPLEVEVSLSAREALPEPVLAAQPLREVRRNTRSSARPHHHHDYAVAPDHDRAPHDPALVHARAELAPDLTPAMPRFVLANPVAVARSAPQPSASASSGALAHGDSAGEVVPESAVDSPARLMFAPVPVYPEQARAFAVEADAQLELVVDASGAVVRARLRAPLAYGLDRAALEAVQRYRFAPARLAGRPVAVRMMWTVSFVLR